MPSVPDPCPDDTCYRVDDQPNGRSWELRLEVTRRLLTAVWLGPLDTDFILGCMRSARSLFDRGKDYDRLLFDTDFSFQSYQDALRETGFKILDAEDLSKHLKTSYQCLGEMARRQDGGHVEKFQALSVAYEQMVLAMDNDELGWGLYLCQK